MLQRGRGGGLEATARGCLGQVRRIRAVLAVVVECVDMAARQLPPPEKGVRNDLARLDRARLVVASESGEGRRLDEATVKSLTGGDTVTARYLYGEHFEFQPQFKLALVTNHLPRIDGSDEVLSPS